jgi:hypothetical protein
MTDNNGTIIEDLSEPAGTSFNLEPVEANPVEAAMEALEKDGAKFGDEDDATPEPKEDKKEPEVKAEEKPAKPRAENGKFAKAEPVAAPAPEKESLPANAAVEVDGATGQEDEPVARSSGERNIDVPPARFLASAKTEWGNTPQSVREEVYRAIKNMDDGIAEYQQDRVYRKELSQFEDMAKQAGTTVRAALENYTGIDKLLRENPQAGVERILQSIGVTPQQYAQHILGQAQQQQANPAMAHTQQLQGQIQQLQQQIQQLTQGSQQDREQARLAEVERTVIAPFIAEHPRYHELEEDIAFFLNSGRIPSNLPERKRLEEAYFMAEQINPVSHVPNQGLTAQPQRPINPAGKKSVKGAPGGAKPPALANLSGKEAIDHAMRAMGL